MSNAKRILLQCTLFAVVAACMLVANYYRQREQDDSIENNAIANGSATLMSKGRFAEAISQAEEAIKRMPEDALGYYVRGLSRLKLLQEQGKLDDMSELARCKQDLLRAQQLTEKDVIKNFCTEFLQKIEEFEKRAVRR